jgi:hypothetical protein
MLEWMDRTAAQVFLPPGLNWIKCDCDDDLLVERFEEIKELGLTVLELAVPFLEDGARLCVLVELLWEAIGDRFLILDEMQHNLSTIFRDRRGRSPVLMCYSPRGGSAAPMVCLCKIPFLRKISSKDFS